MRHPIRHMEPVAVITSIDLVAIINQLRDPGKAELRHSDFMVKLENHPGIDSPKFSGQYKDSTGRTLKCYNLPKRECELMVMSESLAVQAKVYDRMVELEFRSAVAIPAPLSITMPNFADPVAAARAWADTKESEQRLQLKLASAAPAVEFVDRYVDSTGLKSFRQVCKLLGAKEPVFRNFLEKAGIMYRLSGEWMPHAKHLDAGRFAVKVGVATINDHAFNSARFTPKGVQWVASEWAKCLLVKKA